jgi:hypothetical protein
MNKHNKQGHENKNGDYKGVGREREKGEERKG